MKIKRSRDPSFQILASNLVNMVRSQAILYKFMHNRNKYDAWSNKPGRYGGEEEGSRGLCQATLSGKPTWGQLVHMLIPMHTVITFCIISKSTAWAKNKDERKKFVLDACNASGPIVRAAWCSVLQTCGSLSSLSFHHYYLHFIIIGSYDLFFW